MSNNILSRKILIEFRKACLKNAFELYEDAKTLFNNKKWSRSFFLSTSSLEETGKYLLIGDALIRTDLFGKINENRFWKILRSHKQKYYHISTWNDMLLSSVKHEDSKEYFKHLKENQETLDSFSSSLESLRGRSIHADIIDGQVNTPIKLISRKNALKYIKIAETMLTFAIHFEKGYLKIDKNPLQKEKITASLNIRNSKKFFEKMLNQGLF